MLSKLITVLQNAELEMTAEEIADMLWLALQMDFVAGPSGIEPDSDISDDTRPDDAQELEDQFSQKTSSSSTDIHMNPRYSDNGSISHLTGLPFRSPAASALPDTLSLIRALRPFMRRISSKMTFVFNENATVQTIAEAPNNIWLPILDPAPVRWFDIALVIDEGASMMLWKDTIAEVRVLLEHLGAFRDVRVWRLATDDRKSVQLYAETGFAKEQSFAHNPKELIDPSGRRLILVVTDCVSLAWHSGEVQQLLDIWGKKNLVTLIQMLPRRLWHQTALDLANTVQISASLPEIANASLKTLQPFQWFEEDTSFEASFPVPVVTLEPKSLLSWSHIVTGSGRTWITGKVFERNLDEDLDNHPPIQEEPILSAHKRVQLFHANASQTARRLAGLLAAAPVPVSLQVIRLIQQTMLPQAGQVHIAEVLLSGLLEEIYRDEMTIDPDHVEYDFIAGIRDELLNAVPIPDGQRVLREISTFVGQRYGQTRDFLALVTTREKTGQSIAITSESRPFAQITATVLRRFGGDFASLAETLERQVKQLDAQSSDNQIETRGTKTTLEPSQTYSYTTSQEPITLDKAFLSKTWCDLNWTEWIAFDSPDIKTLPTGSGVYRIWTVGGNELFYIGHTGRNLRERIGDLIRNTMRDPSQMPFNDPHTAAPSLWAWRDATGISFECSVSPLTNTFSDEEREALVQYLLWQYRLGQGKSTLCNYGRIHPNYVKSGNRSTGRRGYRLPEGQLNTAENPSFPPLDLEAVPHEKIWMGLEWSDFYQLDTTTNRQDIISASGIYKILDADTMQLLFIGYSANLRMIFQTQARKNWLCPHPSFAFSVFPGGLHSQQVAEIESDLIGGYYTQVKAAPKFQFGNYRRVDERTQPEILSTEVSTPVGNHDINDLDPELSVADLNKDLVMEYHHKQALEGSPLVDSKWNSEKIRGVFISHSSKDNTFGNRIAQDLRETLGNDNAVWYDTQGDLNGGDVWWDKMVSELVRCNIFIIIASPEAMGSEWTRREFLIAQNEGKRIICLLYRKCSIWIDLKIFQSIDFLSPITYQTSFEELLKVIGVPPRAKKPPSQQIPQGTLLLTYDIHTSWLGSVAWSPDGSRIASGGGDGTVRVWNAFTSQTLRTYRGHQGMLSEIWSIIWSPDSTKIASAGNRAAIQVWNSLNGQNIAAYKGHSSFLPVIANMAWSPDGQFIASTNIGSLKDQFVHIWLPVNGLQTAKLNVSSGFMDTSPIGGVAWSPDSKRLACGLHGEIRIYDVLIKRHIQTYKNKSTYAYYSVCWTPDGKTLICAYPKQAIAWDTTTGNVLYTYDDHTADIRDMAVSPDSRYMASASNDKTVHIWETATGKRIFKYEGHKDEVAAVTWSPDGTRIASACKDGTIHVWQTV